MCVRVCVCVDVCVREERVLRPIATGNPCRELCRNVLRHVGGSRVLPGYKFATIQQQKPHTHTESHTHFPKCYFKNMSFQVHLCYLPVSEKGHNLCFFCF